MDDKYSDDILKYQKYKTEPQLFIKEVLGIDLLTWQIDVCNKVIKPKFLSEEANMLCLIAVAGGNNTGKSFFGKCLMLWHFATQFESRNVMMTNSERQTKSTGYYGIQDLVEKCFKPDMLAVTEKYVLLKDKEKKDTAGKWDIFFLLKASHESALTGMHFPRMFFFFDECLKFPDYVWNALETMLASGRVMVYACANPLERGNKFAEIFECERNIYGWERYNISLLDIPQKFYSKAFVEQRLLTYGERDPRYRANILGQFPFKEGIFEYFDSRLILEAMNRPEKEKFFDGFAPLVMGLDISLNTDYGSSNAYCLRRGSTIYDLLSVGSYEEFLDFIIAKIIEVKPDHVYIDGNGLGGSFVNDLKTYFGERKLGLGFNNRVSNLVLKIPRFFSVKAHSISFDPKFKDKRTQMGAAFNEWLKDPRSSMPFVLGLEQTLNKFGFGHTDDGKILLSAKKDFRDAKKLRVGNEYSLDIMDALLLSFYRV